MVLIQEVVVKNLLKAGQPPCPTAAAPPSPDPWRRRASEGSEGAMWSSTLQVQELWCIFLKEHDLNVSALLCGPRVVGPPLPTQPLLVPLIAHTLQPLTTPSHSAPPRQPHCPYFSLSRVTSLYLWTFAQALLSTWNILSTPFAWLMPTCATVPASPLHTHCGPRHRERLPGSSAQRPTVPFPEGSLPRQGRSGGRTG